MSLEGGGRKGRRRRRGEAGLHSPMQQPFLPPPPASTCCCFPPLRLLFPSSEEPTIVDIRTEGERRGEITTPNFFFLFFLISNRFVCHVTRRTGEEAGGFLRRLPFCRCALHNPEISPYRNRRGGSGSAKPRRAPGRFQRI